ncbi:MULTISPECIES: DUF2845 domain-containing protein [unclassified Acinetobacter]|uniref:DUF2845 domain-containing protein n=1 Tax=unclassified Acinetobacter TaxID=196816 RepID=UPI0020B19CDA|nr:MULTISPECIES: DUF2845 domain-containing protein [unclassified Acinetobacter]
MISTQLYAAVETNCFRIHNDIISVGDSISQMISKAGNPISQHSYMLDTGNNTLITATDLVYQVGNEIYTLSMQEGRVTRIIWDRS